MKSRSASSTADPLASASATVEIGRFAPSPTGPLHLGSLLTAVASYAACARVGRPLVGCEWKTSIRRGAYRAPPTRFSERSIGTALHWDELIYQHQRIESYRAALEQLRASGHTFACTCSRTQTQESGVYPGTCRHRGIPPDVAALDSLEGAGRNDRVARRDSRALRAASAHGRWRLRHLQTRPGHRVSTGGGGRRCSAADHARGSRRRSARQHAATVVALQTLGCPLPRYAHVPVLADRSGQKLSKQTRATAVDVAFADRQSAAHPRAARTRAAQRSATGRTDRIAGVG